MNGLIPFRYNNISKRLVVMPNVQALADINDKEMTADQGLKVR